LGSLYTAVASFLDARAHGGRWLLRMEDLDRPREVAGSAAGILCTLEAFGFEWDGEVVRQRDRSELYVHALETLRARDLPRAPDGIGSTGGHPSPNRARDHLVL
jgi:glutamyl-Q tRNA(Asp) synthetase